MKTPDLTGPLAPLHHVLVSVGFAEANRDPYNKRIILRRGRVTVDMPWCDEDGSHYIGLRWDGIGTDRLVTYRTEHLSRPTVQQAFDRVTWFARDCEVQP